MSGMIEVVKRDLWVAEGGAKVNRDLAKLNEEMRTTRLKAGPRIMSLFPLPRAQVIEHLSTPGRSSLASKPALAKVLLSPTPRRQAKQFLPSAKKGKDFNVPDGIIAYLTRECGGNVPDSRAADWGFAGGDCSERCEVEG
jgi:hypothetical protein